MFWFILAIVLIVAAVIALFVAKSLRKTAVDGESQRSTARWISIGAYVAIGLAVVSLFFAFTFKVGAKEYGVLTTFGKPSGTDYGSGLHGRAPWQKLVTVDGKVKTFSFSSSDKDTTGFDQTYPCLPAQLGNGPATCVDVTVRWQIAEDQASVTYANYGSDDPAEHFGQAVIRAQMKRIIPDVVGTYNPIAQLKVDNQSASTASTTTATFTPDRDALSKLAQQELQTAVGNQAVIQSVSISDIPLDKTTQDKLSQFIQEQANTRTAAQKIQTNINLARANKKLEQSLENSPGLLVKQCLDGVEDAITKTYPLPGGYGCFSGGSSVLVNGTMTK